MKTEQYNPSKLETELAEVITKLRNELEAGFSTNKIVDIRATIDLDNPLVNIKTQDEDGDPHEMVIKIIQRPDNI